MNSIRSFIAIPLSSEIAQAATKMSNRLKEAGDGIKWVPTDNLHLTLKFLGEVYNTEVPKVCTVVQDICETMPPFELVFHGSGGMPSVDRARIIHAGVIDESNQLTSMVTQLEVELAKLGFKPESRDYRPHLTLGRAKARRASDEVMDRVKLEEETNLGSMVVEEVQVIASFLDKQGPTYQIMDVIELG